MPESRAFVVTETRQVKVAANSCVEAAQIAQLAFDGKTEFDVNTARGVEQALPGVWGYKNSSIRQVEVEVREGYK